MTHVCLGDVAREIKQKVPVDQELPTVGLEHLDPGEVELAHWDEGVETTFTKAFSKGQVLFGRRRAYLRKAAVAPFDGICSGDITVIAPKDNLSPRLLPFIIQNDALFEHAVTNSAGSLSPRVKWQSLSQFEFELPSIAKQEDLADILWTAQETRSHYRQLLTACDDVVKSQFVEMFDKPGIPIKHLEDIADIQGGITKNKKREAMKLQLPYLRVANILPNELDLTEVKTIGLTEQEYEAVRLISGDLLIVEGNGSDTQIGRSAIWNGQIDPCVHQNHLIRVRLRDEALPLYVQTFLSSSEGRRQIMAKAVNTSGLHTLSTRKIRSIEIPVPPFSLQREFADFATSIDKSKF
ncbi:restriction endonuclease subunit S, partial [Ellagibacter isourolithinifaciens]|uniref:restriction endonuclease subunit S n=2 Tax=Coriobacteriia TaxID=84998 RepID=UPI003A934E7A